MSEQGLVLEVRELCKNFSQAGESLRVLAGIDLPVRPGERIVVLGRSGSGKSTLLHLLAGLADPTSGSVWVDGVCLNRLSSNDRALVRRQTMGFVYQFHHLLPEFTALENVMMPLRLRGCSRAEARERAQAALQDVMLAERASHRPARLSGGERQRVAVARALVSKPKLVLADEPTGNLDRENARDVFNLMRALTRESDTAYVLATHDTLLTEDATRVVKLELGRLVDV